MFLLLTLCAADKSPDELFKIFPPEIEDAHTLEQNFRGRNFEPYAQEVANNFNLDRDALMRFVNLAKYAKLSKRVFHTYSMGQRNPLCRTAKLESTLVKVTNENGVMTINFRKAWILAKYDWNFLEDYERGLGAGLLKIISGQVITQTYEFCLRANMISFQKYLNL